MTCRKVKKRLPLHAGGDLSPKAAQKIERHLRRCASCRKELESWQEALGALQSRARKSPNRDWSESEWKTLMASITAERIEKKTRLIGPVPRWALAGGLAGLIILAGFFFIFRDAVFNGDIRRSPSEAHIAEKQIVSAPPETAPDIPISGPNTQTVSSERPVRKAENRLRREETPKPDAVASSSPSQDVIEVALVSQESGLQVVWIFDKNFDWKGEEF